MDLRQRVIEAATKSFTMFGYKGTTVEQIAKIANVGKGTIYTFFDSKESLFTCILNNLVEEMKRIADRSVASGGAFFTKLERAIHEILIYRKQHELFVKLFDEAREIGTAAVKDGLRQVQRAIVQYIAKELHQGIRQGDVKPCNPELVAFIMLRTYTGLITEWSATHPPLQEDDIKAVFHQVFAEGLANRKIP